MKGSKRIATDLCKQIERESIIAELTEAPEGFNGATVLSSLKMKNTALDEQIKAYRQGGSE